MHDPARMAWATASAGRIGTAGALASACTEIMAGGGTRVAG